MIRYTLSRRTPVSVRVHSPSASALVLKLREIWLARTLVYLLGLDFKTSLIRSWSAAGVSVERTAYLPLLTQHSATHSREEGGHWLLVVTQWMSDAVKWSSTCLPSLCRSRWCRAFSCRAADWKLAGRNVGRVIVTSSMTTTVTILANRQIHYRPTYGSNFWTWLPI